MHLGYNHLVEMPAEVRDDLLAALRAHEQDVVCAWLFGSFARGQACALSDVDVAVLFDPALAPPERFAATLDIRDRAQRIEGPRIDLTILNEAPPALQHRVVSEGRLLGNRDDRQRVAFEVRAIREYLDFLPVLERYDEALFQRARDGRFGS